MECERATVLLSGMIDSALGPIARLRVHRHVAGCNACAAKLEELRAMQSAIRTKLPYHRAPPGLAARIGAALPREEPPRGGASVVPHAGVQSGGHRPGGRAGRRGAHRAGHGRAERSVDRR